MTALRDKSFTDDQPVVVTVVTVVFNHGEFLRECFEGILDQECDFRVEVIVHDDASVDGTVEIIREYAERYPAIFRPILQAENQYSKGLNAQYCYALPASQGDYIAICDGDDYWRDPSKLARQVGVLEDHPDVAITYGRAKKVDEQGRVSEHKGGAERDLSAQELKSSMGLNTLTTCFRNIFRDKTPPMYLRTSTIGDLTLWALLGYHGRGVFLPDMPHAFYRVHSGGMISQQGETRQTFMTAIAHLSIAAHHFEHDDVKAGRLSTYNCLRALVTAGVLTPKAVLRLLIRSLRKRG